MLLDRRVAAVVAAAVLGACSHGEASLDKFSARYRGAEILPVEFVKQREAADCGAAALTSVARYWGTEIATGLIFKEWAPANPAFGYSIGELHAASDRLGLASARLLEQPDYVMALVDEGVPVIAPVAKPYERRDVFDFMLASMISRLIVNAFVGSEPTVNHYVVLLGADEQLVYLLDPQDGYRVMARTEFLDRWSDLTLEFVPGAGTNVAAFAAYREPPKVSSFDAAAAPFSADLAGYDGVGAGAWTVHMREGSQRVDERTPRVTRTGWRARHAARESTVGSSDGVDLWRVWADDHTSIAGGGDGHCPHLSLRRRS
jgi:hypothetical protein